MVAHLQLVSRAAYASPAAFVTECARFGGVRRSLQTRALAAAAAADLPVVLLARGSDAWCDACLDVFACFRCGATGRLRGDACPHCAGGGTCNEGTGGWSTYAVAVGFERRRPYRATVHDARARPGVSPYPGHTERHDVCAMCGGSGRSRAAEVFGFVVPARVEMIVEGERPPAWAVAVPATDVDAEEARGGESRRPGSFYFATDARPPADPTGAGELAGAGEQLEEAGIPERVARLAWRTPGGVWMFRHPWPVVVGPAFRGSAVVPAGAFAGGTWVRVTRAASRASSANASA